MSTALDHRLVREYLRQLDAALAGLPALHARELREQIAAHLDELLSPDAGDEEVAAALSRVGDPAELVAEAAPESPAGALGHTRRTLRVRLAGLGWRRWLLIGTSGLLIVVAVAYYIEMQTAPELTCGCGAAWWYPQDRARQVETSANGTSQTTVPIRSGQRQGFVINVVNDSRWTQTVLGPAAGSGDSLGSPSQTAQISVNAPNRIVDNGGLSFAGVKFVLPGVIPPHQVRALRVLWTSTVCMQEKGDAIGLNELVLRVRVGWITRIETIDLGEGWYLAGPSHGRCH